MNPCPSKIYHQHDFDPKQFLNTYASTAAEKAIQEELLIYPLKQLHKKISAGYIKGDTLIDITIGPVVSHLLSICENFNNIIILEPNETCIMELEAWISNKKDAFDWSHLSKHVAELEGKSNQWQKKEERLKQTIKSILKCDLTKENPTDPVVLPKADCLLSVWALDAVSQDQDAYRTNLKNISSLLKIGGHLLLFGAYNAKYYSIGEHKYHALTYNEDFLSNTIKETGFAIESLEVMESKLNSDILEYGHSVFVTAVKDREI